MRFTHECISGSYMYIKISEASYVYLTNSKTFYNHLSAAELGRD